MVNAQVRRFCCADKHDTTEVVAQRLARDQFARNYDNLTKFARWLRLNRSRRISRAGVPACYRRFVWSAQLDAFTKRARALGEAQTPRERAAARALPRNAAAALALDAARTFISTKLFSAEQPRRLLELLAATAEAADMGYCQGMNYIAAFLLVLFPHQSARDLLQKVLLVRSGYFQSGMHCLARDLFVARKLVARRHPLLRELDAIVYGYANQWFLSCYTHSVPWLLTIRIWDSWLMEGDKIFFRVLLGVLQLALVETKRSKQDGGLYSGGSNSGGEQDGFEESCYEAMKRVMHAELPSRIMRSAFAVQLTRAEIGRLRAEFDTQRSRGV